MSISNRKIKTTAYRTLSILCVIALLATSGHIPYALTSHAGFASDSNAYEVYTGSDAVEDDEYDYEEADTDDEMTASDSNATASDSNAAGPTTIVPPPSEAVTEATASDAIAVEILTSRKLNQKRTGVICEGCEVVYAQASTLAASLDLVELFPEAAEPLTVRIHEILETEEGTWYNYSLLGKDAELRAQANEYPYIPAEAVELDEQETKTLRANDVDGMDVAVRGVLPEDATLSAEYFEWSDTEDIREDIENCGYELTGLWGFAYDIDLGTTEALDQPVTVTIENFDLGYYNADNMNVDVYHILHDGAVEKLEGDVVWGGLTFETDGFSKYYFDFDVAGDREQVLNSLAEPGYETSVQRDAWFGIEQEEAEEFVFYMPEEEEPVDVAMRPKILGEQPLALTMAYGNTNPLTSEGQIKEEGGSNQHEEDGVSVSKTIEETEVENVFDITLEVKTRTDIQKIISEPDMAVVVVMDISNTMNSDFGKDASGNKTSRYDAAMTAAESFIDMFDEKGGSLSKVGMVAFNTDAHEIFPLQNIKDKDDLKALMNRKTGGIIHASGYASSRKRFTNIEGGLKRASDMLDGVDNTNKFIIFLSDGFPTTYLKNDGSYIGYDPYTGTGTIGKDGVFYDGVRKIYCNSGTSYSDKAAIKARTMATSIKKKGVEIFSIGVDVGGQTIKHYIDSFANNASLSVVDRTGTTYEIGDASDKEAYIAWLRGSKDSGIGSGYYCNSTGDQNNTTSTAELEAAFAQVFMKMESLMQESATSKWVVGDPIPDAVEFISFFDQSGNLAASWNQLAGQTGENFEDTAGYDNDPESAASNTIFWDLKNSGYTMTGSADTAVYTYSIKYRVRLKNEAVGFGEREIIQTNGKTTLDYRIEKRKDGQLESFADKTIDFPIPAVEGYLTDFTFKKVSDSLHPVEGAEFTLTHDTETCSVCQGDGKNHVKDVATFTAVSDAQGLVTFEGVPSGHFYTLEETKTPTGYYPTDHKFQVQVAYDVTTITENLVDEAGNPTEVTFIGNAIAQDFKVINEAMPMLPETGGMGTKPYQTTGILMIALSAVYLLFHEKLRLAQKGRGIES